MGAACGEVDKRRKTFLTDADRMGMSRGQFTFFRQREPWSGSIFLRKESKLSLVAPVGLRSGGEIAAASHAHPAVDHQRISRHEA